MHSVPLLPVVVQTTQCSQVLLIRREAQVLNLYFVQPELAVHISLSKIPNDDICFEAHVSGLAWGEIATRRGAGQAWNAVGVSSEEGLVASGHVFYYDPAAKWVDNVLIVWMSQEATYDTTCSKNKRGILFAAVTNSCIPCSHLQSLWLRRVSASQLHLPLPRCPLGLLQCSFLNYGPNDFPSGKSPFLFLVTTATVLFARTMVRLFWNTSCSFTQSATPLLLYSVCCGVLWCVVVWWVPSVTCDRSVGSFVNCSITDNNMVRVVRVSTMLER